ncbi:MAG: hypothetical protein QM488_00550 [Rhizobiaceae bacterium]
MTRKPISVLTAAAISMSISFTAPVGIMAVSSLTVVPEAQAFGIMSIKNKATPKTIRVVKKKGKTEKSGGMAPLKPAEFIILHIR